MTGEQLQATIRQQPFRPFAIRMVDVTLPPTWYQPGC
jgi:hypothetical protein